MLTLVCSAVVIVGGVIGVIKPELMFSKKKKMPEDGAERDKLMRNMRIGCGVMILVGVLLLCM